MKVNFYLLQLRDSFIILTHMMFRSIELNPNKPQGKDTLWNLSQLLGDRIVATPEKIISDKMFPENKNNRALIMTPDLCAKKQTLPKPSTKSMTRINFQHYRIKSSLKLKGEFLNSKDVFNAGQDALMLKRHNSQSNLKYSLKYLANPLKFPQKETNSLLNFERPFKSQQIISGKTIIKKLIIPSQLNRQSPYNPEVDTFQHHWGKSLQINKRIQPPTLKQSHFSNEVSPKSCYPKRSFLRKGSSLQKQIVVNLLKNKLIKQHEFDIEKEYTMNDIIKMVKLYKGVHNEAVKNPQLIFSDRGKEAKSSQKETRMGKSSKSNAVCPINVVKKFQRSIEGWEIQQELIGDGEFIKKDHDQQSQNILTIEENDVLINPETKN